MRHGVSRVEDGLRLAVWAPRTERLAVRVGDRRSRCSPRLEDGGPRTCRVAGRHALRRCSSPMDGSDQTPRRGRRCPTCTGRPPPSTRRVPLDRRELARCPPRGARPLRAARRDVHRGGHPGRRGGAPSRAGGPGRQLRGADAASALRRHAELGLRRGAAARRAPRLRRAGGAAALRGPRARARAGGVSRRGLQPPRSGGELPRRVRALHHLAPSLALGRRHELRRARCRAGPRLHGAGGPVLGGGLSPGRAPARRGPRHHRRQPGPPRRGHRPARCAGVRRGGPTSSPRATSTTDGWWIRRRRAGAATQCGRTTSTTPCTRCSPASGRVLRRLRRAGGAGGGPRARLRLPGPALALPRNGRTGLPPTGSSRGSSSFCLQNHDQIGNRPTGERLASLVPREALEPLATLLLLGPGLAAALHGRGARRDAALPLLHQPHRPGRWRGRSPRVAAGGVHRRATEMPDPQAERHLPSTRGPRAAGSGRSASTTGPCSRCGASIRTASVPSGRGCTGRAGRTGWSVPG